MNCQKDSVMKRRMGSIAALIFICMLFLSCISARAESKQGVGRMQPEKNSSKDHIPVTSPMTTDLAGSSGAVAIPSVLRVLCPSKNVGGTGFLHKSGKIITAAHIVAACKPSDLLLVDAVGKYIKISDVVIDNEVDIALLTPDPKLGGKTLSISSKDYFSIGLQVSTWGYPSGYNGLAPLLSSGYLSGIDAVKTASGQLVKRWVVNAAFNKGNSGGPLVDIETSQVIGVVSSKLAPLPSDIESSLKALKSQGSGMMFKKTHSDGTTEEISQAQVIEEVLQYLRSQTQLVIGYAVMIRDLKTFLKSNGVEP